MKEYQLTVGEWAELVRLSKAAGSAPVIALSSADALAGRDLATMAREDVDRYWGRLGEKYGFDGSDVQPVDENHRKIRARPVEVTG